MIFVFRYFQMVDARHTHGNKTKQKWIDRLFGCRKPFYTHITAAPWQTPTCPQVFCVLQHNHDDNKRTLMAWCGENFILDNQWWKRFACKPQNISIYKIVSTSQMTVAGIDFNVRMKGYQLAVWTLLLYWWPNSGTTPNVQITYPGTTPDTI